MNQVIYQIHERKSKLTILFYSECYHFVQIDLIFLLTKFAQSLFARSEGDPSIRSLI
jgi:hypothetical protein